MTESPIAQINADLLQQRGWMANAVLLEGYSRCPSLVQRPPATRQMPRNDLRIAHMPMPVLLSKSRVLSSLSPVVQAEGCRFQGLAQVAAIGEEASAWVGMSEMLR